MFLKNSCEGFLRAIPAISEKVPKWHFWTPAWNFKFFWGPKAFFLKSYDRVGFVSFKLHFWAKIILLKSVDSLVLQWYAPVNNVFAAAGSMSSVTLPNLWDIKAVGMYGVMGTGPHHFWYINYLYSKQGTVLQFSKEGDTKVLPATGYLTLNWTLWIGSDR